MKILCDLPLPLQYNMWAGIEENMGHLQERKKVGGSERIQQAKTCRVSSKKRRAQLCEIDQC